MKKIQEIIGLPIISISDGVEVGKIKGVVIDDAKGAIDYVIVDSRVYALTPRVIASENILGIGHYALTIEKESIIADITQIPVAVNLLQKNVTVTGSKVLTRKGHLIGKIGDIYIDEDNNCNIAGLEFIKDGADQKIQIIPRDKIITFGKNMVIVKDDVESNLLNEASELEPINADLNDK